MTLSRRIAAAVAVVLAGVLLAGCAGATPPTDSGSGAGESGAPATTPAPETPALVLADLLTAPVPSLCEHEAGTLVGGALDTIAPNEGFVSLDATLLADLEAGATESTQAVIAEDAQGEPYIAAHVTCNRGGVSWPGRVVIWDASLTPVAQLKPEEHTGGDRERIAELALSEANTLLLKWLAPAVRDAACCYNISAAASFTVDTAAKSATVTGEVIKGRGADQLRTLFEAAVAGAPSPALTLQDQMFEGIETLVSRGATFDLEGMVCDDTSPESTVQPNQNLVCSIPTMFDGELMYYLAYPALDGEWGKYSFTREWELYPAS